MMIRLTKFKNNANFQTRNSIYVTRLRSYQHWLNFTHLLSVHGGILGLFLVAGIQVVVVGLESGKLNLEVLSLL